MAFSTAWEFLQTQLAPEAHIPTWSAAGQHRYTQMIIKKVTDSAVFLDPNTGDASEYRMISRSDFAKVFRLWEDYKEGNVDRGKLSEKSQNTTYIISILHWLEEQNGGHLPR